MPNGKLINDTGNRYGRLIVKECAGRTSRKLATWRCRCDCGNYTIKNNFSLQPTKYARLSCGCGVLVGQQLNFTGINLMDVPLEDRKNLVDLCKLRLKILKKKIS